MKRLIVNADDFGLSRGINRGIIEAFGHGTLTSASIMANMPGFDDAILLARENQGLGIGVHLNILRGKPILSPRLVPTLTDRNGYFIQHLGSFIKRLLLREINIEELKKELRAQVERVLNAGIKITHLDSEKHLHCYPKILKIVLRLAKDYKIGRLRYINEKVILFNGENLLNRIFKNLLNSQYYKSRILTYLCRLSKQNLDENSISYPDQSFGILSTGRITKRTYKSILESLGDGTTEIICHPGYLDNELIDLSKQIGNYYINSYREEELNLLLDPHLPQFIKKLGIRLINYADL